jgi:hypothetical protein
MDRTDRGKGNIVQLFGTLVFLSKIIVCGCRVMREEQPENTRRARHEQADERVRKKKKTVPCHRTTTAESHGEDVMKKTNGV